MAALPSAGHGRGRPVSGGFDRFPCPAAIRAARTRTTPVRLTTPCVVAATQRVVTGARQAAAPERVFRGRRGSLGGVAAVDEVIAARDEGGGVTGEERDQAGDLLRRAHPPQGVLGA